MAPILLPKPRELDASGEGVASLGGEPRCAADRTLPAQGFALEAGPEGVAIRYGDEAGLRYARSALEQLRAHPEPLPSLCIRDWPDFPVRGYMLDVSRDRVPTRETLEHLVARLALLRINHLELYTEHTFAFRDHEIVWRDASPITPDDILWLDALCAEHGIELVANQNTFGHMARWLRHDAYAARAEAPDGWRTKAGMLLKPAVLAPTEDNAEFALGLVREMLESFTSRQVNIGCDETFELGKGRSSGEVAAQGRGRVYLEHLKRLLAGLHADGCDVLFWGDILREHPELVSELPKDRTTALAWWYEAPVDSPSLPDEIRAFAEEFGISERAQKGFAGHVPPFAEADRPFWVCPGTSTWNTFVGRWTNAKANLLDAATEGLAYGAGGYLITDWGDNGHMQPPSVSLLPLAYGAAVSWCLEANRDLDAARALDVLVFRDEAAELGGALRVIGDAYLGTGRLALNSSSLFGAVASEGMLGAIGAPDAGALRYTLERLGEASEAVARSRPQCTDGEVITREIRQAIRLARHGAWRMLRETGESLPSDAELRRDLAGAIEEQRLCWALRSRPGGLRDSVARLERTLATYGED